MEEGQDGTMLGEFHLTVKDRAVVDWRWFPHRITVERDRPDPMIAKQVAAVRARFVKGDGFKPHVNPLNASVLRTPIDTVIGFTRASLHRSNFSDAGRGCAAACKNAMPAVIEDTSHNFLADAFREACRGDVGVIRGFRYGTHIGAWPHPAGG